MNRITKINPAIAPQAHAEITKRCLESGNGIGVFKGLCYEITFEGEVWHIGHGTQTFENTWDDALFGFEVPVEKPVEAKRTTNLVTFAKLADTKIKSLGLTKGYRVWRINAPDRGGDIEIVIDLGNIKNAITYRADGSWTGLSYWCEGQI